MRFTMIPVSVLSLLLLAPSAAFADITAFLGVNATPSCSQASVRSAAFSTMAVQSCEMPIWPYAEAPEEVGVNDTIPRVTGTLSRVTFPDTLAS